MENSQVQNDLRRKFFVVLIMLSVFFVSDAFCHDDGTRHTHGWNECPPPPGPPPTDDNPLPPPPLPSGTYKPPPVRYKPPGPPKLPDFKRTGRDIKFHYPGCSFAGGALPPDKPNPADPTPQQQTPADERNQAEQTPRSGQTPGTDPTLD